ncbi:hypothetical protein [Burkholderia vietnamiensis]|uniref:hypothetical protein n=1 Tax=Burkholderia vietnamiensis TaxID=60552 RepID=UPI001B949C58|nr:hypothetical protein [Burkholderia vietnamiensis]MBR8283924.1 hypothetical protein [Burkholderia vietnamiensis]
MSSKKVYPYPEPRVPFYPEKEPLDRRLYSGAKRALGACLRGVGQFFAGFFGVLWPLIRGLLGLAVFIAFGYGLLSLFASGGHLTARAGAPAASAAHGAHTGTKSHQAATRRHTD